MSSATTMLSTCQIAGMRAFAARLLDMTCSIDRPTNSSGVWAQTVEAFNPVATLVACAAKAVNPQSMVPLGTSGVAGADLIGIVQGYTLWFVVGQDIRENDRVTLSNGLILRVQSTQNQQSSYYPLDSAFATQAV